MNHAARVNGALPGVTYSQADALDLPFGDESFDAVVCQFGIMFFPDKHKGMSEMNRVLKPGGTLALNVWDSFADNPTILEIEQRGEGEVELVVAAARTALEHEFGPAPTKLNFHATVFLGRKPET